MNEESIDYAPMDQGEEDAVYSLIKRVFKTHISPHYSPNGKKKFLSMLSPEGLSEIAKGDASFVLVAKHVGHPVGVVAVINRSHIALLFVDTAFQGYGIGSRLLEMAADTVMHYIPGSSALTVNSSPNSVSFYMHAGFIKEGEEVDEDGLRFTPMKRMDSGMRN